MQIAEQEPSSCIRKDPCPECDSSDACAVYDDGHAHCFSCDAHFPRYEEGDTKAAPREQAGGLLTVTYAAIPSRKVPYEVARSNGYGTSTHRGQPVQVAEYCDATGKVTAQKIKTAAKDFTILGDAKAMRLWPMHRFASRGKKLLICEGETDLLCWQSVQGNKWPAVSIPNGASGAKKAILKCLEWVEGYDEVVICFDADAPGQEAALEVAQVLKPGKARIMQLPQGCKDICEAVQKGQTEQLVRNYWNAQPYRPDGIVGSDKLLEALLNPPKSGTPYPWEGLNKKLRGIRPSELVTLTAGTGVGKSSVAGLLAHHLIKTGHKIGYISLEESLTRTAERLVGVSMGRQLHLDRTGITPEDLTKVWDAEFKDNVVVFNHFGTMDSERLLSVIRHMRQADEVEFIFLDHLSILVSGWGDGDERRLIDNVMTALRSIVEQTGVGMILISHLKAPGDTKKSHEEGARPKLNDLRGSASIKQISDIVIGIQRDQSGEDGDSNTSTMHVLKNRPIGLLGEAGKLRYNQETGIMEEIEDGATDYGF